MGLVPKNLPREIRNNFNTIRNEVGKEVLITTEPLKADCPNCIGDHNGVSTGVHDTSFIAPVEIFGVTYSPIVFNRSRCPVCFGKGVIEQANTQSIKALVRWNPSGAESNGVMERTPAGLEGANVVELKAAKCYYDVLKDCIGAVIDSIECELLVPPVIRSVNSVDVTVVAYFKSTGVGHDVR